MSYVITIDGPAGAGKSSVARRLSASLGIKYLDTGAIYRAIGLILNEAEVSPQNEEYVREVLKKIKIELRDSAVLVNNFDVSGEIRTPRVDKLASIYSALPCVREALLGLQQEQENYGSLVVEGRDVGSVVFPKAQLKFFLTATPEARARRRYLERKLKTKTNRKEKDEDEESGTGEEAEYLQILEAIKKRDEYDSNRKLAPLSVPAGAVYIDTSDMTEDDVVNFILRRVNDAVQRGLIQR